LRADRDLLADADRDLIARWADGVTGPVLDVGCGPGHWTAFLRDRGVAAEGVDLTPEFVAGARRRFPGVPFRVGAMAGLAVPDGALAGILSWYSIIHTAPGQVPAVLTEFSRCLRPGGSLRLGFCEGPVLEPFDHAVVTAHFWPVADLRRELEAAGFAVLETHTRTDPGSRPQAAVVARRQG
jgi:SAM-dependent methyltransferase